VHHLTAGPWGLHPPFTRQTIDQRVLKAVDAAVVVGLLTAVVIWGREFANRSTNFAFSLYFSNATPALT
jgi:hypothetical protein